MLSDIITLLVFVQFRCSLQCQINMNLIFHIPEDGFEIEFHEFFYKISLAFKCLNSKRVNLTSSRYVLIWKIKTFTRFIIVLHMKRRV